MPEVEIGVGSDKVTLKVEKIAERISKQPIVSPLPEAETVMVDLGQITTKIVMEGFWTNYGDKSTFLSKLVSWDGSEGGIEVKFPHEGNRTIKTCIDSCIVTYIEGEGQWKFTLTLNQYYGT
ncbi:MAG: hypothetical protein ACXQTM_03600 [Methanosarcinales archaeon]